MTNCVKFNVIKKIGDLGRIGCIKDVECGTIVCETPCTFLYFKYGTVPFLTPDIVKKIEYVPAIIQCPLNYMSNKIDVLEKSNLTFSEFIGYKERNVMLTQYDSGLEDIECGLTKTSISAQCYGGIEKVPLDDYFKIVRLCKPIIWQSPCDNETEVLSASEKRLQKSVERTISYFKNTVSEHEIKPLPGLCMTSFVGGTKWLRRRQCIERMLNDSTSGIAMDGMQGINNPETPKTAVDASLAVLAQVSSQLLNDHPQPLPLLLPRLMQPSHIVRAVMAGTDLFDGSLPYWLSQAGVAWVYGSAMSFSQWLRLDDDQFRIQLDQPIDPNCACQACDDWSHSRGYICHLLRTDELLARILLMIHNSTQYFRFFQEMRDAMRQDRFDEFHDWALKIECPPDVFVHKKTETLSSK